VSCYSSARHSLKSINMIPRFIGLSGDDRICSFGLVTLPDSLPKKYISSSSQQCFCKITVKLACIQHYISVFTRYSKYISRPNLFRTFIQVPIFSYTETLFQLRDCTRNGYGFDDIIDPIVPCQSSNSLPLMLINILLIDRLNAGDEKFETGCNG
jgi:hypothetical protein